MPIQPSGGGAAAPVDAPYATFGADATLTAEVNLQQFAWVNLIKNSPGQIVVDGAEPQWWGDVANATITDEDAAGEGIADLTERVFKVVTSADDVYGYGTSTFADESLLDAGQTVVSFGCWVYCASASKASIGIYGANLGLQESVQHTGSAAWEFLSVEGVTLNGADASIQTRLIIDTGTAYFTKPMLNPGPKVLPWLERTECFVPLVITAQVTGTTGDVAWSDTDATGNTDPLATAVQLRLDCTEPDGVVGSALYVSHDSVVIGADSNIALSIVNVLTTTSYVSTGRIVCNDSQVFRYKVEEVDADNDVTWAIRLQGYWRWAP